MSKRCQTGRNPFLILHQALPTWAFLVKGVRFSLDITALAAVESDYCLYRIKDVCDGNKQIPFMKENETGKWLYDSDKMAPYLEDKFPDLKKIGKPDECPQV